MIPEAGLRPVLEACDATIWEGEAPPPRDELLRAVAGCDGVLTMLTDRVDDEFLDAAGPGLRVVSNMAVGYDNIDVPACTRRGVPVGNTPGVLTETTADLDLGAHPRRRSPSAGGRAVRPLRGLADLEPDPPAGPRRPRGDARDRRLRADRPGGRATRPRVRDARPVCVAVAGGTGDRGRARRDLGAAGRAAGAGGLRDPARGPEPLHATPDRRRRAPPDEADARSS